MDAQTETRFPMELAGELHRMDARVMVVLRGLTPSRRTLSRRIDGTRRIFAQTITIVAIASLASCATAPVPNVQRKSDVEAAQRITDVTTDDGVNGEPQKSEGSREGRARPQIRRGSGQVINRSAASAVLPHLGTSGAASFNFEGESLHAVIKAVLGDMLGQNYVVAPGVQGTVTLATPKPVSPAEALSLLEMVLGWNNARLVYSGGRYNVAPSDQALPGNVSPRTGPASTARGYEVRTVPLKYVSASEMENILKPYARPNAIINVDGSRNIITVGGSRAELENYLRTIDIFDVDWLAGMSVGVFPLQSGKATEAVADLEKIFGEQGKSPMAGMFRFMPLQGSNAILVVTPQPTYLDHIQQWLERIDGAGAGASMQLFSYDLKFIKAGDLAERLADVFGGSGSGSTGGLTPPSLMPGSVPIELQSSDSDSTATLGGGGPSGSRNGNASLTLEVGGDRVGVSAVEETNSILVRSTAAAWKSVRDVIDRLDVMPQQVHIEAQIVEVQLTGDLSYGVNWYFERAVTDAGLPSAVGRTTWSTLAGSITRPTGNNAGGLAWTFLGRNAAAVISALDSVTDLQLLQTPSLVVRNNAEATLNVGSRIPISSVTINPGDSGDSTYSQVQYLDTGTILKVRPRVTQNGMVFLDIVQEVSTPGTQEDRNGNVRIDTRKLKTEAAIQSGDTIMLAGLINDGVNGGSAGFPGLSRIPIVGALFGMQRRSNARNEVIILLTPTIIRNPQEARDITDEYGRRFRAMEPLQDKPRKAGQ